MKKVLVLMLVLGMASMATAGLSIWVNGAPAESSDISLFPSDTITIGLYSDGSVDQSKGYLMISPGDPGSWTGGYNVYSPPSLGSASVAYLGYTSWYGDQWMMINTEPTTNVLGIGILADFEFHYDGGGDVTITYMDDLLVTHDTLIIHQIPEPMTIGLLGLGGLFLRRRK